MPTSQTKTNSNLLFTSVYLSCASPILLGLPVLLNVLRGKVKEKTVDQGWCKTRTTKANCTDCSTCIIMKYTCVWFWWVLDLLTHWFVHLIHQNHTKNAYFVAIHSQKVKMQLLPYSCKHIWLCQRTINFSNMCEHSTVVFYFRLISCLPRC